MVRVNALILSGYGINCEREMALASELAGATTTTVHMKTLFSDDFTLSDYQIVMFPGGFSFGDDLGAGKALANKLTYSGHNLREKLAHFVDKGGAILGVCNGFQLLVKLGLLPGNGDKVSLAQNDSNTFQDRWVNQTVTSNHCIFTQGVESLYLPIRHGEGKFVTENSQVLETLKKNNQIALKYQDNPNGSIQDIAGICDPTGRILGMMPHPEAALFTTHLPGWTREKGNPKQPDGIKIFQNSVKHFK